MINVSGCSEIVESPELTPRSKMNELIVKHRMLKPGQVCSVEDDINKLFEAMDNTILGTNLGLSNQVSKDSLRKRAMKRPMRSCSKIGFSDSVSLKEAFRGLSISHASKMAAVKRLSKQANSSRTSNSVSINKNLVDISLVPEESTSKFPENIKLFPNSDLRNRNTSLLPKADEISKFQDEVEFPQSSIRRDEITLPGYRPHMSKDVRWEVIHCFLKRNGGLSLEHFKLIKKLGGGDIGAVYLAELTGTNCLFALKIMDNEFLISRNKSRRAETEIEILRMLDHPFLPSLFACFTTERFTVLVMQYCPLGDLHVLRKIQPKKRFSEKVSRFYVAEVVVALEYLHMLGIVYRDLKLENVLVREDGHIILSDFDLSLRCSVSPTLVETSPTPNPPKTETNHNSETKSTHPLCCFQSTKSRKQKADLAALVSPLRTNARSNSFVGTHEYLSPEIIRGEDHGSAVDWWTLGIFLYELIYGKTPFKGSTNKDTLSNIVSNTIEFPDSPVVSPRTRGLIVDLLEKEPESRLGSVRGANEIKQHPFFKGINWALIRCIEPPKLSSGHRLNADVSAQNDKGTKCKDRFTGTVENMAFDMF